MKDYAALAAGYDGLMADGAYEKRAAFLEKLFQKSTIPVHTVLDLACGTGTIACLLSRRGYQVTMTTSSHPDIINALGENSHSVIITAYNDRNDIRDMIHTITITKDSLGSYVLHNAYKQTDGQYTAYSKNNTLKCLWDTIGVISQGQAAPICIIGIR